MPAPPLYIGSSVLEAGGSFSLFSNEFCAFCAGAFLFIFLTGLLAFFAVTSFPRSLTKSRASWLSVKIVVVLNLLLSAFWLVTFTIRMAVEESTMV